MRSLLARRHTECTRHLSHILHGIGWISHGSLARNAWHFGRGAGLALFFALLLLACRSTSDSDVDGSDSRDLERADHQSANSESLATDERAQGKAAAEPETAKASPDEAADACQRRREEVLALPSAPGAPSFERQRALLLARAKGEPLLFVRTPTYNNPPKGHVKVSPEALSFRRYLQRTTHHWDAVKYILKRLRYRPDIVSQVLLKEGYLYAEHPHLAYALSENVAAHHLFDAERIWIQRGDRVHHAKRNAGGEYVYENALETPVTLLQLDRLGVGKLPKPLHVDLRSLRHRLNFDRLTVEHLTKTHIVGTLHYGDMEVPALLELDGAHVKLGCEVVPREKRDTFKQARQQAAQRSRALHAVGQAMRAQVEEALPFDEPRNEVGIQDGQLRSMWERAYFAGRHSFSDADGFVYDVFTKGGQPRPPQVCVDFVTDTLERASGTWWNPRDKPRHRVAGKLQFSDFESFSARRITTLLEFAKQHPDWFELHTTSPNERIPMGQRQRFFRYIEKHADLYRVGDVVIIRGFTPSDEERMHFHSFFVYATDPVTGVPLAVVGNAETPHIWTLENEARRTPKRAIWYRIRPRLAFLERFVSPPSTARVSPLPLVERQP